MSLVHQLLMRVAALSGAVHALARVLLRRAAAAAALAAAPHGGVLIGPRRLERLQPEPRGTVATTGSSCSSPARVSRRTPRAAVGCSLPATGTRLPRRVRPPLAPIIAPPAAAAVVSTRNLVPRVSAHCHGAAGLFHDIDAMIVCVTAKKI